MPDRKELLGRITTDPNICFGKPCVRGTRIWVSLIVENLADGLTERELLEAYPPIFEPRSLMLRRLRGNG